MQGMPGQPGGMPGGGPPGGGMPQQMNKGI